MKRPTGSVKGSAKGKALGGAIPKTPNEWLAEIAAAYQEAFETLPFMPLVDVEPN
jgi:hypothetical protein